MPTIVTTEELLAMRDHVLAPSRWLEVGQDRIDLFAEATEDRQFIHVDRVRAAQSLFGTTIAHGFLSLSLLAPLWQEQAVVPEGMVMAINYGLDRVRFLQPVKSGSRVRLLPKVVKAEATKPGRILVTGEAVLEIEGEEKPALVATPLTLYVVRRRRNRSGA